MKNNKKRKVIKELFINDFLISTCFWSLIFLMLIPFFKLPKSLELVLHIFFLIVSLVCLPFSLYRIKTALYLAKKGFEITAKIISIENVYFGNKVKFEYEYDGHKYDKAKFFHYIFFADEDHMKLLIDIMSPSKFIILEFKKKSVFSIVRNRNS
jgi:hypothetical protein